MMTLMNVAVDSLQGLAALPTIDRAFALGVLLMGVAGIAFVRHLNRPTLPSADSVPGWESRGPTPKPKYKRAA